MNSDSNFINNYYKFYKVVFLNTMAKYDIVPIYIKGAKVKILYSKVHLIDDVTDKIHEVFVNAVFMGEMNQKTNPN